MVWCDSSVAVPPPSSHERSLIDRANRGDEQAFETLYREHRDWVVSLAVRLTGSEQDALDVLQETFTYFFRKFPGFVLKTNLRGFLFPVVRNNSITVIRRRKKVVDLDEARKVDRGALVWHPPPAGDLERMVAGLPEPQRQVVLLRFGADMRLEEIAVALEIPAGTVKSRLHNALKTLRKTPEE